MQAMTRTSTIMRTREGIQLRISESVRLESAVTKISPRHITSVFLTTFVTARVEQMPSTCTKMGFCEPRLSLKSFQFFPAVISQPPFLSPPRAAPR